MTGTEGLHKDKQWHSGLERMTQVEDNPQDNMNMQCQTLL